MANEYCVINQDNKELGLASISVEALNNISLIALTKINGIAPAKKESDMCDTKVKDNEVEVNLFIKVNQGVDVVKTCSDVQNEVYTTILDILGVKCKSVNVNISGFIYDKD